MRQVVWSAVALLVVAGGAFAVTHRETGQPPAPLQLTPAPTVIYGEPIMFEGTVAARTEFTQQPTGAMQCTTIDPNLNHVRIARAAPYNGPCAHLMAEQATARWVCVSAP